MPRIGMGVGVGLSCGSRFQTPREIARDILYGNSALMAVMEGSSRCSPHGIEQALFDSEGASDVPWNGLAYLGGWGESQGHTIAQVSKPGGSVAVPVSTTIPGIEVAFGGGHHEVTFTGLPHTATTYHARRMQAAGFTSAVFPRMFARMSGRSAFARVTTYRHAAGLSVAAGTGPRFMLAKSTTAGTVGFVAPNYCSPSYLNDTTGSGYETIDTEVAPASLIDGSVGIDAKWSCELNWTGPEGQIVATDPPILTLTGPGVTLLNWSAPGITFDRWTNRGVISDAAYNILLPQKARGFVPQLWLEAGHPLSATTVSATRASIQAIVDRFRAVPGFARASAVVFVSYRCTGCWDPWADCVADACAGMPGVLSIDTRGEPLQTWFDNGWIDPEDGVHAGTAGRIHWAGIINDQLVAAAA